MSAFSIPYQDFYEDNFDLIGINTSLPNYRLSYFINKFSHLYLERVNYNLTINNDIPDLSFVLYEFKDSVYQCEWFLIQNTCKVKSESFGIFREEQETKHYLIPEFKNIDYFIKVEGCTQEVLIQKQVQILNTIPLISTAYLMDKNKIKTKEVLIF